ncbi:MAG: lysophospholipid acyltransferase family protein, partial [Burkholderiales bacterium]
MMARIGLALVWQLHFLPLGVLAKLGEWMGMLLFVLGHERRHVARTNLQLCFPQWSKEKRETILRQHFRAFGRNFLEHGILWWGSKQRIEQLVRVEGLEHWRSIQDRPVILLAPHFIGLDMGGIRLASDHRLNSVYSRQKSATFDAILIHGRTRFGQTELFARQDGIRPMIKSLKNGEPFYYLPDMDYGSRDSVFVPFFGVPAATITGLSRIARLTNAAVVPCVTCQLSEGGAGYVVRL